MTAREFDSFDTTEYPMSTGYTGIGIHFTDTLSKELSNEAKQEILTVTSDFYNGISMIISKYTDNKTWALTPNGNLGFTLTAFKEKASWDNK